MSAVSPTFMTALRDATVFAPELPEAAAFETLARLEAYERMSEWLSADTQMAPHY